MKNLLLLLSIFLSLSVSISSILFSMKASAVVTEFSGTAGYQKQVYGSNRENSIISTNYGGTIAFYLWNNTAIELNYTQSREVATDNTTLNITGYTLRRDKTVSTSDTIVFGLGFRQAFAGKNAMIRPSLSLGYARQTTKSATVSNYTDTSNNTSLKPLTSLTPKSTLDSVFATLAFQLRMTRSLSFKLAVNTVFKAFDFNKVKDNLKYSAGFTWYF